MFYRSGWLRCDVSISIRLSFDVLVGVLSWCIGLCLSIWHSSWCWHQVLLYYTLLLYIYYITIIIYYIVHIYYYYISYILYYTLLFCSSIPFLPFPIFSSSQYSSSLHSQSFLSQSSIPPFPIQKLSIRVGIWISLFIFQTHPTFDPACFIGVDGWGV